MDKTHKSSSHIQVKAEHIIFNKVEELLNVKLEKNKKIFLSDNSFTYIQPDFYSEEKNIIGEIFSHIGKPRRAQDNKIANDILKMILLERITGKSFRKIIVTCDIVEMKKLQGRSALAESIRQFGIEILYVEIDDELRGQILNAQNLQKMTNA